MSDITCKFTQKQKEANRRAGDSKETGLGDLEPKLLKTIVSAPWPGRLANTSDFRAVLWARHWSHTHGRNWTVLVS